jgi:[acyl-carrier-protein] S-malonyltransferase
MIKDKIDTFVEVGAGNVLTGLVRKINKDVNVFNISTVEDLDKLES